MDKTLYFGDNLNILREHIKDESVDLIYLDPPFNSKATYNVLFQEPTGEESKAQIKAFDDTWHWTEEAEKTYQEIVKTAPANVVEMITAFQKFIKKNDMMAYLTMMTIRLLELRRILKSTGSIYLHCDPTASHYLKVVMDTIFGVRGFRNEIIWKRKSGRVDSKNSFGQKNDIILFYAKSEENYFCHLFSLLEAEDYVKKRFRHIDEKGRRYMRNSLYNPAFRPNLRYEYKGYQPPKKGWAVSKDVMERMDREGRLYFPKDKRQKIARKIFLDEYKGKPVSNLWLDIPFINPMAQERLGYPTQKPRALLERILKASAPKESIVLDPFCGCGTTISACEHLNRNEGYKLSWKGIDITHLAINLIKWRLKNEFSLDAGEDYKVTGEPEDLQGAKELAKQDKFQFQWWALSLINARPYGDKQKGADTGIDGYVYFLKPYSNEVQNAIVEVKGGKVGVKDIRVLKSVVEREGAPIGIYITLNSPTKSMREEAAQAGFYEEKYPKIQMFTVQELLDGKRPKMPTQVNNFVKRAERVKEKGENMKLPMK